MAAGATRLDYRIRLSNVDRSRDLEESLIVAQHPSENEDHVTLRVLAWCLLNEERLEFGPGVSTPDVPDLWAHDLTGRIVSWIECGSATADRVRKAVQHNPGASVHVVLDEPRRAAELVTELGERRLPKGPPPQVWTVAPELVQALAQRTARRQKWTVTIVGEHFYIDADGTSLEGAVTVATPEPAA
jgi:uncharacterized protein YaeQ